MLKIGVVGASGYVGGELLRLLITHPKVELNMVTSRTHAGDYVHRVHPSLKGFTSLMFSPLDTEKFTDINKLAENDVVFTAVPHGKAVELVKRLYDLGVKVIDLSADYRLKNPKAYVEYYGYEHPYPEMLLRSTYGVPELHKEDIKNSKLISCPGCMAITSLLALAPLINNDLIDTKHLVVDSKIGSSGAGGKPSESTHHAMRYGVIRPYKPVKHRHTAEIEQELSFIAKADVRVSMTPHAVNVVRGILCTNHTFLKKEISVQQLWKEYRKMYKDEPFVRLIRDTKGMYKYPDPKFVVGSNFCDVGFDIDEKNNRLVALSASDNLMKGAAGTAIQCMNIMEGFNEKDGLYYTPFTPV